MDNVPAALSCGISYGSVGYYLVVNLNTMRKVTKMATATLAAPGLDQITTRYSVWESALLMNCSPDKVRRLIKEGRLAFEIDPDDGRGKIWITGQAIEDFKARNRVRASLNRQVEGMLRRGKL